MLDTELASVDVEVDDVDKSMWCATEGATGVGDDDIVEWGVKFDGATAASLSDALSRHSQENVPFLCAVGATKGLALPGFCRGFAAVSERILRMSLGSP